MSRPNTKMGAYTLRIAKRLFEKTRQMPSFSGNEFRGYGFHKLPRFKKKNSIGFFFSCLKVEGYIIQVGHTRAAHDAAKGREIKTWEWTTKALEL